MKLVKSPIKWAGGKSWLVPKVLELYSKAEKAGINQYVDLFCGSCVIPLNLPTSRVVINDSNSALIKFWLYLRVGGDFTYGEFINTEEEYYQARARFNVFRTARDFYYLNRTCFNGLYRENSKGEFNVPYGKYKNPKFQSSFPEITDKLKNWLILNKDFRSVPNQGDVFTFADPPYDGGFTDYQSSSFSWQDQIDLAEKLTNTTGIAVATNKATTRILELYQDLGFSIELLDAPRRISCNGDRTPVKEMFAVFGI